MSKTKNDRPKMGDLIKSLPQTSTPIQEVVRPIESKPVAEELVKINGFYVSPDLAKRMKFHAVNTNMKQREILIEALNTYLPK